MQCILGGLNLAIVACTQIHKNVNAIKIRANKMTHSLNILTLVDLSESDYRKVFAILQMYYTSSASYPVSTASFFSAWFFLHVVFPTCKKKLAVETGYEATCHSIIEFHYNTIVGTQEFKLWRQQFLTEWANMHSIACFD